MRRYNGGGSESAGSDSGGESPDSGGRNVVVTGEIVKEDKNPVAINLADILKFLFGI